MLRFEKIKGKLSKQERELILKLESQSRINLLSKPISSIRFELNRLFILPEKVRHHYYNSI